MTQDAANRAATVRLMIFDVDGILTDGRLYIAEHGEAMKAFHVHDGHGLKMLQECGVRVGILSSRASTIVTRRASELGIELVVQGAHDKGVAFAGMLESSGLRASETGFMGDDLVDLPVLTRCGFAATVPDAPGIVRNHAHYVSSARGGHGAARELSEFILRAQGRLDSAIARYLT